MRLALGLVLPPGGGGGAAFSPLSLAPFISLEPRPSVLFQDDEHTTPVTAHGQPIGAAAYQGSAGADYFTQATEGIRPTYGTDGGLHWVDGSGTQWLRSPEFTELAQPHTIVLGVRFPPVANGASFFTDGGGASNRLAMWCNLSDVSQFISLFSGNGVFDNGHAALAETDCVFTGINNGASSSVRINGVEVGTGNAGAQSLLQMTLMADLSGANGMEGRLYSLFLKGEAMSADDLALIEAHTATLSGVTL